MDRSSKEGPENSERKEPSHEKAQSERNFSEWKGLMMDSDVEAYVSLNVNDIVSRYPDEDAIQMSDRPWLSKLDVSTLYELHHKMVTFGKVFCTKGELYYDVCRMREDCKSYASSLSRDIKDVDIDELPGIIVDEEKNENVQEFIIPIQQEEAAKAPMIFNSETTVTTDLPRLAETDDLTNMQKHPK